MARADLILNLVKAGAQGDQAQFQKTVEALAADERAKRHTILADRLLAQLRIDSNGHYGSPNPSAASSIASSFVNHVVPERTLDDIIISSENEEIILDLIEEQHRSDLLRSYNLEPRHRILLAGPPGNGKTSLAEAIAERLTVPLVVVRYESVIGSYLGETAQRISQVFEYARSRRCVLFFDEFDAVAKERGDLHETGEIKRVVSSLLLQIDSLPSYVVVVTASNHPELLDRAVWRRFQVRLELPMPKTDQIEEWFRRFQIRTELDMGLSHRSIARSLDGLSFSEIEDFGIDVLRKSVLEQPTADIKKIAQRRLGQLKARFAIEKLGQNEESK